MPRDSRLRESESVGAQFPRPKSPTDLGTQAVQPSTGEPEIAPIRFPQNLYEEVTQYLSSSLAGEGPQALPY